METGQRRGLRDGDGEGVPAAHDATRQAGVWGAEGLEQAESSCHNLTSGVRRLCLGTPGLSSQLVPATPPPSLS